MGELGLVHRHELSGALHGLMRVRCFTQDDAHIFMTPEQIKDEIKGVVKLIDQVYSLFGFEYHIELSTMPEDHMGDDWRTWEHGHGRPARARMEELGRELRRSTRATAPSTARSWISTWWTPSAAPGSAAPSSWICSCPSALSWNIPARTATSTAR